MSSSDQFKAYSLSTIQDQLRNQMKGSPQVNPLDFIDAFIQSQEKIPSFGVKIRQPGLQFAFPDNTSDKFYEDLKNPIEQPNVERFIFNRSVFDEDNPYPIT